MKVSLNWAQYYSNVDLRAIGDDKLLDKIGAQLGAIEEVDYWGPRFDGITVVKVLRCEKHNNADKLSVCVVDDDGRVENVERDSNGHVQVVCGAPNVKADMLAAWIPPGVTVPSTLGKEPLVLEARDIRGQVSNGMLASPAELGISDSHAGILEIKADEVGDELSKPGTPFKQLYSLDDIIADIENKMFTHRPDCFGILGVARELAGIQGLSFKSPDWYLDTVIPTEVEESRDNDEISRQARDDKLNVTVADQNLVPRFMAVAINDVKVQPSPLWVQAGLARVGIRSINNIVDITNYVMHLTGQPLHAYDADKLRRVVQSPGSLVLSLETRNSKKGERIKLLGDKELELQDDSTILITSNDVPVGIGGVMGGADTEVDDSTKNIVLECATFDMYSIRRTAMKYGLFTDAVTRFTKGQSPLQNDKVLGYALKLINEQAGGQVASEVKDIHGDLPGHNPITINKDFINARLGGQMNAEEMAALLRNVEFKVDVDGDNLIATAPFWRTDIEIVEDIVEEVGRLHGYDNLPLDLPRRSIKPTATDQLLSVKTRIRNILSSAGANEILTYTFVHGDLMDKVGQNKDQAFQLANALSPDLQYFRLSLIPSLLEKVRPNLKQGYGEFALFEINPVHAKDFVGDDKLPVEDQRLALVFAADEKVATHNYDGAPYFQAKKYLTDLLAELGLSGLKFEPAANHEPDQPISQAAIAPFEKQRSAIVKTRDGEFIGELGEFRSTVRKSLKLPRFIAGFELDVAQLAKLSSPNSVYTPIPRFPKVEQDITLRVDGSLAFADLQDFMEDQLETPAKSAFWLTPLNIYKDEKTADKQNVSFRLTIASYERTLTSEEVNKLLEKVAAAAKAKFGAERV